VLCDVGQLSPPHSTLERKVRGLQLVAKILKLPSLFVYLAKNDNRLASLERYLPHFEHQPTEENFNGSKEKK
jgi:hypothetical protein